MNVEEKLRRAEEEHAQAATALDAAKVRHATAVERVESTKVDLAEAHARLADDPHASKRAREARAAHDDAVAVADILLEGVSRASLAEEVAAATVTATRAELAAVVREADIIRAAELLTEAMALETRAAALRSEIDTIVGKHVTRRPVDTYGAGPSAMHNAIREAAGLPALDWMGNPIAKVSRVAA